MNDQYIEEGIKCVERPQNMLIRMGLIFIVILSFFLVLINPTLIVAPVISIAILIFIFTRLKIEYEYIYAGGQIDFDRISGNAKRKTLLRVDIENAEIIAPTNSTYIREKEAQRKLKYRDYSSYRKDVATYTMLVNKNGELYKIKFEPSERLVKSMKAKQPRKVKEY